MEEQLEKNNKLTEYGTGKSLIKIISIGFEPLLNMEEYKTYSYIYDLKGKIRKLKYAISELNIRMLKYETTDTYYKWLDERLIELQNNLSAYQETKKTEDEKFHKMLQENTMRTLDDSRDYHGDNQLRNIILAESELTRCLQCQDMQHSDDIISVTTYYTEIFNAIIHNGFTYKQKKYVFFTAGAGQTRCKKSTFIAEDKINEIYDRLFCGLTRDDINRQGGMNTNKYLAYTSLCQTNSEIWKNFNIDKAIVVDDIEYDIPDQEVRYIYTESPEDKQRILEIQNEISKVNEKLHEINKLKENRPKAYRRPSEEVADEKEKKEARKNLDASIRNIKTDFQYAESQEGKQKLLALQNEFNQIEIELHEIRKRKLEYPKGYRRTEEEIAHEKLYREKKNSLVTEMKNIRARYHKASIKKRPVTIPFTDGFGISLKKMETSMFRLPFMKGLIAYCPRRAFREWCAERHIKIHRITDIYGKKHSINEIDYIFTKSQFKMWNYYHNIIDSSGNIQKTGWEIYKENFKKFMCNACRCNVDRGIKLNTKTNYQSLITLTTEMQDSDIYDLARYDIDCINGVGNNIQCMLNLLGANECRNNQMSNLQKSLALYPEMLNDQYIRSSLKNSKYSLMKKMRSGKFDINGAYVYCIPDPLACLQWWFTDMDKSNIEQFGFVKKDHVSCNLFNDKEEVDCLRSPHLDHAHCIRKNQTDELTKNWIKSSGVYIGMTDIMSRLLMYDNDGDKLLVHNNKTIINCAKSFQKKYGMIPNYYEMPKANPELLSNTSLFNGIVLAYHHGNIGAPSNEITKIWSTLNPQSVKEEIQKAIDTVSLRCVDVNFTIDYAKTLYKPYITSDILSDYKRYSKMKVPYFFMYAKNKKECQVEQIGKCNIDRISNIVKCKRIEFKQMEERLSKYSYETLMTDPKVDIKKGKAKEIGRLYRGIENRSIKEYSHLDFSVMDAETKKRILLHMEFNIKKQKAMFLDIIKESPEYITNVLVRKLRYSRNKDMLWKLFGDVILCNIQKNLMGTKICKICGKRFAYNEDTRKKPTYCKACAYKINIKKTSENSKNKQNKIKSKSGNCA